jgi:hypothetical protein
MSCRTDHDVFTATDAPERDALLRTAIANKVFLAAAGSAICTSWTLGLPCPFRQLTGYDCPGCGVTRALVNLSGGHVVAAAQHNLLFLVLLFGLVLVGLANFIGLETSRLQNALVSRRSHPLWLALITVWTVLRSLPMFSWFASTLPA